MCTEPMKRRKLQQASKHNTEQIFHHQQETLTVSIYCDCRPWFPRPEHEPSLRQWAPISVFIDGAPVVAEHRVRCQAKAWCQLLNAYWRFSVTHGVACGKSSDQFTLASYVSHHYNRAMKQNPWVCQQSHQQFEHLDHHHLHFPHRIWANLPAVPFSF